jgi:hypothetical protein
LYHSYVDELAVILANGITHNNEAICAVSDDLQLAIKFVNITQSFWILSKFGILLFHHKLAESIADNDSAKTKITFKAFHSHKASSI